MDQYTSESARILKAATAHCRVLWTPETGWTDQSEAIAEEQPMQFSPGTRVLIAEDAPMVFAPTKADYLIEFRLPAEGQTITFTATVDPITLTETVDGITTEFTFDTLIEFFHLGEPAIPFHVRSQDLTEDEGEGYGIVWNIASEMAAAHTEDDDLDPRDDKHEERMTFALDKMAELLAAEYPNIPVSVYNGGFENQYAQIHPRLDWSLASAEDAEWFLETAQDLENQALAAAFEAFPAPEEFTDTDARRVASEWHAGQFSALYALSSSGAILEGIDADIEASRVGAEADCMDIAELEMLAAYVARRERFGITGPVDGWSSLSW